MATSSVIKLSPTQKPTWFLGPLTRESADAASRCLQKNHDEHHIFFNHEGFHDHIVHHVLTLFALGASPEQIQTQYEFNAKQQRPKMPTQASVVQDMHDPASFAKYLGNENHYSNYLAFFKSEIDSKGWENVLQEYLFARTEQADDMLVRLFAGFLHPFIHLGFGIEFVQPAIIAEALAQAAVHDAWIAAVYLPAERQAAALPATTPTKPLTHLLDDIAADSAVRAAPHFSDANKIRDGLLARAPQRLLHHLSQHRIPAPHDPAALRAHAAESTALAAYFAAAAQHPRKAKAIKYDFFHMHCVTSSVFLPALLAQPWLAAADKARLLEWKGRTDLAMYASRGAAPLDLQEIAAYVPAARGAQGWEGIAARVSELADDGHAAKLVRALAAGQALSAPFEAGGDGAVAAQRDFRVSGKAWLQMGHMAIDSVEHTETRWVRSAGFEEAWDVIGERERAQL